jgi:hypothetical protein
MPKELEMKIVDKNHLLDFYAKPMNRWPEDKNKKRIKDTGLFLNWDQADQYAQLRELESNYSFNKLLLKKIERLNFLKHGMSKNSSSKRHNFDDTKRERGEKKSKNC